MSDFRHSQAAGDRSNPFANRQQLVVPASEPAGTAAPPVTTNADTVQPATAVTESAVAVPRDLTQHATPTASYARAEQARQLQDSKLAEPNSEPTASVESELPIRGEAEPEFETDAVVGRSVKGPDAVREHQSVTTSGAIASLFAGAGVAAAASEWSAEDARGASTTVVSDVSDVTVSYTTGVAGSEAARQDKLIDQIVEPDSVDTVSFESLVEDTYETIMDRVEFLRDGESEELELQIDPPELGRLLIRVARMADDISARITVVDPGTFDMLQGELTELRNLLDQSGVSFSSFDLQQESPQQRHTGSGSRDSDGQAAGRRSASASNTSSQRRVASSSRSEQQAIDILA